MRIANQDLCPLGLEQAAVFAGSLQKGTALALEQEALLLRAAVRAGLLDAEKGTAALVVYSQLRQRGVAFSFGEFLVERGLLSRLGLERLLASLRDGEVAPVETTWQVGRWELLELLGEGQLGSVFKAQEAATGRLVALKILAPALAEDPEALQRFLAEASLGARLKHPHLVQVLQSGQSQGLYYFAMELIEGGTLRRLLDAVRGPLPELRALRLAEEVASALQAAHLAGLIHRDVKPENILLGPGGQAKLADLGIAVFRGKEAAQAEDSGEFWGTPEYLAPEIIGGRSPGDPRSDLYSLGATLFELVSGRPPFVGDSPEAILRQHLQQPVPDPRTFNPVLTGSTALLLRRLLAKEPQDRFPDAASLASALRAAQELRPQSGVALEQALAAPPAPPLPVSARPAPVRPAGKQPLGRRQPLGRVRRPGQGGAARGTPARRGERGAHPPRREKGTPGRGGRKGRLGP